MIEDYRWVLCGVRYLKHLSLYESAVGASLPVLFVIEDYRWVLCGAHCLNRTSRSAHWFAFLIHASCVNHVERKCSLTRIFDSRVVRQLRSRASLPCAFDSGTIAALEVRVPTVRRTLLLVVEVDNG